MNLPVWVTEFDVNSPDDNTRADELETFYRIAFSHTAVDGILMWGFWENSHWRENCYIVNGDWTLNVAGRRYQSLMDEWNTRGNATTDNQGNANFRGFYGTYLVTVTPEKSDPIVTIIIQLPDGPSQCIIDLATSAR